MTLCTVLVFATTFRPLPSSWHLFYVVFSSKTTMTAAADLVTLQLSLLDSPPDNPMFDFSVNDWINPPVYV